MKKALSVTALLLAVLMIAMCCVACGDDDKKSSNNSKTNSSLAGTYTGTGSTEGGNLTISADNTGVAYDSTFTANCVFNPSDNSVTLTLTSTGQTVTGTYTFNGTNLTITAQGKSLYFTKNSSGNGGNTTPATSSLVGSYTCVSITGGGGSAQSMLDGCTLVINSGNSGTMTVMGTSIPLQFDESDHTVLMNGQYYPYSFSGSTLVVGDDDENFTFRKN